MRHNRDTAHVDALVARIAERQHGVVDLDQLRDAGLRIGAINSRVRAGRLHRLHTGVFAVGHTRLSRQGRWSAAVLALGDRALLSHSSAAALWGLRASSAARIHVTVPTSAGLGHRGAIVVHRSRTLTPADLRTRDAIPLTSVARTLLDLAAMLAPGPPSARSSSHCCCGCWTCTPSIRSSPRTGRAPAPRRSQGSSPACTTSRR